MSAAVLSMKSQKQIDEERLAEFRAKRQADKDASKNRLASEFPLLFGKDPKARSTIGKYANAPLQTTPSKKKAPGKTSTPNAKLAENKNVKRTPSAKDVKKTPSKNSKVAFGSSKPPVNNENKNGNIVPKKKSFFSWGKSSNSSNHHYHSSDDCSDNEKTTIESSNSSEIELSDFSQSFSNSVSTDFFQSVNNNKLPLIPEVTANATATAPITLETNKKEVVLDEKIQDVLDFMLETKEIDTISHRRLSGHRFSTEVLRRFSTNLSARNSSNMKPDISAHIDFHAISRDIAEEEMMMGVGGVKQQPIPLPFYNQTFAFSNDSTSSLEDAHFCPSVMTNPNTTPVSEVARGPTPHNLPVSLHEEEEDDANDDSDAEEEDGGHNEAVEQSAAITTNPEETTIATDVNANELSKGECEIGDLEVLYALRNYISTLEEKTFFNNPMPSHPSEEDNVVSAATAPEEFVEPKETIEGQSTQEEDNNNNTRTMVSSEPDRRATSEFYSTACYSESLKDHDNQEITSLLYSHSNTATPVNGIAENKVVIYPRQTQLDEILLHGLLEGQVIDRIRYDNHVKYVISIQTLPSTEISCSSMMMILLKRFSEFKEFRDLLVSSVNNHNHHHQQDEHDQPQQQQQLPIPPLPSKVSMSLDSNCDEETYFAARQFHLNQWLVEVLSRQSTENEQYRDAIYEFISN